MRLRREQTRASRPILYLQPSLLVEVVNRTVEYDVRGKDEALFEIRPSKATVPGEATGLWTLHFKAKVEGNTQSEVHHDIRIVGRKNDSSDIAKEDPELNMKLKIIVNGT